MTVKQIYQNNKKINVRKICKVSLFSLFSRVFWKVGGLHR